MNWQTKSEDKLENSPTRERIDRFHDGYGRHRGSDFNYAHFWGFLEANLGRPIDKVIHDFVNCDWCPARHRTASKIAENVEMNTFKKAGRIYYFGKYWRVENERPVDEEANSRGTFFYVHPDTRVLCRPKSKSIKSTWAARYNTERHAKVRILGDYHQLYKLNGTWYEVKAEPLPENAITWGKDRKAPHDILLENEYSWRRNSNEHPYVKITLKRQLNSKELHRNDLKNDLPEAGVLRCEKCGGIRCTHWYLAQHDKNIF